jgi:hypothetical protein
MNYGKRAENTGKREGGSYLEIEVNEKAKLAEFWLTRAEADDTALRKSLLPQFQEWKEKKYLPVVYLSGREDLYDCTLALLKHNREVSARRTVEARTKKKTTERER